MKGIVGKLTQGAADAGFVYVTDVNAAGDEPQGDASCPAALEPDVTYAAGVVKGAKQPDAGARRSSTASRTGACADALAEAGFGAARECGAVPRAAGARAGGCR